MRKPIFLIVFVILIHFVLLTCVEQDPHDSVLPAAVKATIGYGHDLAYLTFKAAVLDQKRLLEHGLVLMDPNYNGSNTIIITGSNYTNYESNMSAQITGKMNLKKYFIIPIVRMEAEKHFGHQISINNHLCFGSVQTRIVNYAYVINCAIEDLREFLTPGFLRDINDNDISDEEIIRRYGVAVVLGGIYGGQFDLHIAAEKRNGNSSHYIYDYARARAGFIMKGISAGFGTSEEIEQKFAAQFDTSLTFESRDSKGGLPHLVMQIDGGRSYDSWLNSVPGREVFLDYTSNGLLPLYYFAPEARRALLEEAINNYLSERVNTRMPEEIPFAIPGQHSWSMPMDITYPATVEVYVLGAGGGGQGGFYSWRAFGSNRRGTGGAGGGGAAAYVKFTTNQQLTFNVTVGRGGGGGNARDSDLSNWSAGYPGSVGGNTIVRWGTNSITARGGNGGGGGNRDLSGGTGGTANTVWPADYLDKASVSGGRGTDGSDWNDIRSIGGNAAAIYRDSINFGGGGGADRQGGVWARPVDGGTGGGGSGAYGGVGSNNHGGTGGNGRVHIIIR
jgi:hypothetical protein